MLRKVFYSKETRTATKVLYLFITTFMVGVAIVIFGLSIFLISKIPQKRVRTMAVIGLAVVVIALLVFCTYSPRPTAHVYVPIDIGP
jgi:energy-coupling factor transporter transmembrane protein EcfT